MAASAISDETFAAPEPDHLDPPGRVVTIAAVAPPPAADFGVYA